jgi:hypothetical protein
MVMDEISYFLANILAELETISLETAVITIALFLPLVIYWRETGRLFFIGWIVRLIFLPINFIFVFIWLFALIFSIFLNGIRIIQSLKALAILALIGIGIYSPYLIPLSGYLFYLLWFGINSEGIKKYIFFYPKAKRTPQPRINQPKAPKIKKSFAREQAKITEPSLVKIAVSARRSCENETAIIQQLEPHLQALIMGDNPLLNADNGESAIYGFLKALFRFLVNLAQLFYAKLIRFLTFLWNKTVSIYEQVTASRNLRSD